MADEGPAPTSSASYALTDEEESAFASAQAATGMALLHKPALPRVMAAEVMANIPVAASEPSPQRVAARPGAALAPPRPSTTRLAIALCCCRVRWLLVTEEISQVELSRCRGV